MIFPADLVIYWSVVGLRVLVPLTIPRYPLPGILASLILDAIDQTLFQSLTHLALDSYQGYDKALDIYYLAIAYIATLRNWTNGTAFQVSRFLFYYRLLGVVLFELTQLRWLLLVFPNVFEYFFIFYEVVRLRWDPRRLSKRAVIVAAAFIWIVIKLPQEFWIHVAQLDVTDIVKENLLGYSPTADWGDILTDNWLVVTVLIAVVAAVVYLAWHWLRARLPATDWPASLAPDAHLERVPSAQLQAVQESLTHQFFDRELLEKTVLISFLVVIFAQIMPGIRSSDIELALAATTIILVNTVVSETMLRRGASWESALRQGLVMVAVNLPMFLIISYARYGTIPLQAFVNIIIFILLLSLIITLYDRYRPICLARFNVSVEI